MTLQKPPKPIRDKAHVRFVAQLPCCVTGRDDGTQAHHLLRIEGKAMGRRAGDNHVLPLHYEVHHELHRCGNETWFLAAHGIDGPALAKALYEASGNYEQACAILRGMQDRKD